MKKRFATLLAVLLAAVLLTVLVPRKGIADLGDYSGDSDYGGSDYGGSDYGGSDSGGSYDYGGSDYGGSDSSGGGTSSCSREDWIGLSFVWIFLIGPIFMAILVISLIGRKQAKQTQKTSSPRTAVPGAARTPLNKLTPIDRYKALDPSFSPEALQKHLSDLYVKMQECCTNRNVEPIRPYFADALWQQFDRQMKGHISLHRTNHVENISVLYVDLCGFYEDKGEDVIVAEIQTRITDYTLDNSTCTVISGSKERQKIMTYEYALSRPIERRAKQNDTGEFVRVCPNCGAELDVNETVKCPFCDSVVTFGDHDWTVYSIKGISQRTL